MSKNIENGKKYYNFTNNLIDSEKSLVIAAESLYTQNKELSNEFLEKHSTFDEDGECNFDYDMEQEEVWQDFKHMHQIWDEIDRIKENSFYLNVKDENDLSEVFFNNKPLIKLSDRDFADLELCFDVKRSFYELYIENADIDYATIYTIELGNGEVNAILFEDHNETGQIYTINELLDYLNENYPERDELNFINYTLNPQSNDVRLLKMNHKDSDNRIDSGFFLIDKEQYDLFKNGSRRLEDVSVYDDKLEKIKNNSEVADLHNTIVLDYQNTHENKLTQDKMQSLVDRHSPTPNEPKQQVRNIRRNTI
ncbi:hypothetical protein L7E35_004670 [Vibrio parahaemolyticus]|nr:hypothetical protein [Vibrio parahaemolyticus]EIV1599724.1 hypothetical protein [Vibrio parahaemolyticus]